MDDLKTFVDWLYDISPVWPDQVTREELLRRYYAYLYNPEEGEDE